MKRAYVFFNGELLGSKHFYKNLLQKEPGELYCADGGANLMEMLGVIPKELWGDLDSVSEELLKKYKDNNVKINKFPKDKDFTDGELILQYLSSKKYDKIVVIGGLGGRRDHELSNINLLFLFKNMILITENEKMFNIEKKVILNHVKGKTISFIPFSENVIDINLSGFRYPLNHYNLKQGSSICMSNVAIEECCTVEFKEGKLIGVIID